MALKPDREYNEVTDITQFWSEKTAQNTQEEGGIASAVTQGSGVALDHELNVVEYTDSPSGGVPKGVLLQPINPRMSTNRDFKNFDNNEVRPGDKVTLVRKGWLVTDMVEGTPSNGDAAYVGQSGLIATSGAVSAVLGGLEASGAVQIGRFETSLDAQGFAKVYIDI